MEEPVCLNISMENSLFKSSGKGGLGSLMACFSHQAYEKNYPLISVSLLYPYQSRQMKHDLEIHTKKVKAIIIENKLRDTGIEMVIHSNWYPVRLRVFEYPFDTVNNRARVFFLYPDLEGNEEWIRRLEVYGWADEGQVLFTSYMLSEGAVELMRRMGLNFDILHLQESINALAIKPALSFNKEVKIVLTIHTFLPHGHKLFHVHGIRSLYGGVPEEFKPGILREELISGIREYLSLTELASHYADRIYAVSERQRQKMSDIIRRDHTEKISYVSSAVHKRWINKHLKELFDNELPGWRQNVEILKNANKIENWKIEAALSKAKGDLIEKFEFWNKSGEVLSNFSTIPSNAKIFTFAKEISPHQRPFEWLEVVEEYGSSNSIYLFSGVLYMKEFLDKFYDLIKRTNKRIAYILNFDEEKAYYLVSGSDFWINIPDDSIEIREKDGVSHVGGGGVRVLGEDGSVVHVYYPHRNIEESGISHMKALLNGRLVISTPSGIVSEYIKDGYNGFLVHEWLGDLPKKLIICESLTQEEYTRFSKNCLSSSPYVLMERMFEEYVNEYRKLVKEREEQFHSFRDPIRYKILKLLESEFEESPWWGWLPPSEIANELGLDEKIIEPHLWSLEKQHLIISDPYCGYYVNKDGRVSYPSDQPCYGIYYRISDIGMRLLRAFKL
ncbi:MAG: glycogen/starch synthase [Nitrososphaerales archaeon]|nr:glycogen/starch synthase [Nitrososphaerales archaeon]